MSTDLTGSEHQALSTAIKTLHEDNLRRIVNSLYQRHSDFAKILHEELCSAQVPDTKSSGSVAVPIDLTESQDTTGTNHQDNNLATADNDSQPPHKRAASGEKVSQATNPSTKRQKPSNPAPLMVRCTNCGRKYDKRNNNSNQLCNYHPGESEKDNDSEVWADGWEEPDCDNDDDRIHHPEGFVWTCCDQTGDEKPCKQAKHVYNGPMLDHARLRIEEERQHRTNKYAAAREYVY
ncbi:hypothetical protein LTS08_006779 [Lithohypha guttulata]|nr:hypothetical protein LTS08_006779 [Lithohypha guttulata]